jgi:hypothetical protein
MAQMTQAKERAPEAEIPPDSRGTGLCHLRHPRLARSLLLIAALGGASAILLWGPVRAEQAPPLFPQTLIFEGQLSYADYERLFEHGFDVPADTRRLEIAVT